MIYIKNIVPSKDSELLYKEGENNNKAWVNPDVFPYITLSFYPESNLLKAGGHHTLKDSGFDLLDDIFYSYEKTYKEELFNYISYEGLVKWNNSTYHKIELNYPDYKIETYTTKENETLLKIAESKLINSYKLVELNDYRETKTLPAGRKISIPNAYAKKFVMYIDSKTYLPLYQEIYDEIGLYEKYVYKNVIYGQIEFVDIAGLVKGASKGEGLGNQFLSNIREVDAIAHVVRCFSDNNITHVYNRIDPINDIEIIESELILSDISRIERSLSKVQKSLKTSQELQKEFNILNEVKMSLEKADTSIYSKLDEEELLITKKNGLLTTKPLMYVSNVNDEALEKGNSFSNTVDSYATDRGIKNVRISSKIEEELSSFEDINEKESLMESLGIEKSGLNVFINEGFKLLDLITFFTSGEKESKAWAIPKGFAAPDAAGVIHTDFKKGFIAAEVINYLDLLKAGGNLDAKNLGLVKTQGKEYIVRDGDVILFRFNV